MVVDLSCEVLFSLFIVGSVLGFVVEGLWHLLKHGKWESHSALVWGPFCIVYGFGAVAVYLISCCLWDRSLFLQFIIFSLSGAAVEYITGFFQEACFGSVSWDYSKDVLNIGGRTSFRVSLYWGILGIAFAQLVFPRLNSWMNGLRGNLFSIVCIIVGIFIVVNMMVSAAAVIRWRKRQNEIPPSNFIDVLLDKYFDDTVMISKYPNMQFVPPESTYEEK